MFSFCPSFFPGQKRGKRRETQHLRQMEVNQANKSRLDRHFAAARGRRGAEDGSSEHGGNAQVNEFWTRFNSIKNEYGLMAKEDLKPPSEDLCLDHLKRLEGCIETAQKLLNESTFFLPPYDVRSAQNVPERPLLLSRTFSHLPPIGIDHQRPHRRANQAAGAEPTEEEVCLQVAPSCSEAGGTPSIGCSTRTRSRSTYPFFGHCARAATNESAPTRTRRPCISSSKRRDSRTSTARCCSGKLHRDRATWPTSRYLTSRTAPCTFALRCALLGTRHRHLLLSRQRLTGLCVRRMYNLKSCSVFVGPVAGSALLYDCQGCSFSIASQQVRLSRLWRPCALEARILTRPVLHPS